MRAVSLPRKSATKQFPFGFAIAGAGFYNAVDAYTKVNIPGWFDREFGSLDRDRQWLEYLSPMTHTNLVSAPILLYHGENDSRVPVEQSIQLHEKLKKHRYKSDLLVLKGQEHGMNGIEPFYRVMKKRYAFLEVLVR